MKMLTRLCGKCTVVGVILSGLFLAGLPQQILACGYAASYTPSYSSYSYTPSYTPSYNNTYILSVPFVIPAYTASYVAPQTVVTSSSTTQTLTGVQQQVQQTQAAQTQTTQQTTAQSSCQEAAGLRTEVAELKRAIEEMRTSSTTTQSRTLTPEEQVAELKRQLEECRSQLGGRAPEPLPKTTDGSGPHSSLPSQGPPGLALLGSRCAVCHDAGVAQSKGGGHAFFDKGQLALAGSERSASKILAKAYSGAMPPKDSGIAPLTDQELSDVMTYFDTLK